MTYDAHNLPVDDCPLCAAAEPSDLDRLFDAVNLALSGSQLSEFETLAR